MSIEVLPIYLMIGGPIAFGLAFVAAIGIALWRDRETPTENQPKDICGCPLYAETPKEQNGHSTNGGTA